MKLKRRDGADVEWRVVWIVQPDPRYSSTETFVVSCPTEKGARIAASMSPGDVHERFNYEGYTVKSVQVQSRLIGPWLPETEDERERTA